MQAGLAVEPSLAPDHDVRPVQLGGMGGLFSRDAVALEEAAQRAVAEPMPAGADRRAIPRW